MNNQFHEYNRDEFYSLPWSNDFMNADPKSSEFSNAMAEADKYYGPEWTNKQLEAWGIEFENGIENGNITPDQLPENSPIQKEAEQLTDSNPHNDEVRNDAISDILTPMSDELNNRLESSDTGIAKDKDWSSTYKDNSSFQDMIYARAKDGDWLAKRYLNALDRAKGGSFNDREKLKSWEKKLFKNIENNSEWKDYWDKSMSSENAPTYDQLFGNRISDIKDLPLTDEEYEKLSKELERVTESNPEAVQEALPNTPIAKEAAQITNDADKRNDEVNNEAAKETIGMGWNNGLVHDDYDPRVEANNEYDYPEGVGNPGIITERDEDFAGPDELPATIDQIRDEDFVGPDEQLSIYNGGVPEGIYTEPVYDTSDYNFDWDYDIQTLGVKSPEEIPEAPVHNKEQAIAKQRLMKWLKSHGRSYRMYEPENDMSSREEIHNNYRNGGRAAGSSLLGNIGRHSGLSYDVPNLKPLNKEEKHGGPSRSTASGSTELPNSEKPTERTMSMSTINSGETMFGKSGMLGRSDLNKGGEIKVGQSGIKAGFTGHTSVPEELAPKPFMGGSNSNGIYTDLITQILRKFPNGYSDNQITITVNGQNVLVNGKQLGQLSDIELNTLKEIL